MTTKFTQHTFTKARLKIPNDGPELSTGGHPGSRSGTRPRSGFSPRLPRACEARAARGCPDRDTDPGRGRRRRRLQTETRLTSVQTPVEMEESSRCERRSARKALRPHRVPACGPPERAFVTMSLGGADLRAPFVSPVASRKEGPTRARATPEAPPALLSEILQPGPLDRMPPSLALPESPGDGRDQVFSFSCGGRCQ